MKKSTFTAILSALTDFGYDNEEVLEDIRKEINKGEEKKKANAEAYETFHEILVNALQSSPATSKEIYESIQDELPDGVTPGKVSYALNNLWQDEIVKIPGKPNTYRRA